MCAAKRHVGFTPDSDRECEIPQQAMSALPPKADMCSAVVHVCFGPIADMLRLSLRDNIPPRGLPKEESAGFWCLEGVESKAHMCSAKAIRFEPQTETRYLIRSTGPRARLACWGR